VLSPEPEASVERHRAARPTIIRGDLAMTGIDDQFMRNFETSTVMTPADKTKAEEGAQGKGGVGGTDSSGNVVTPETVSNENLSELYLVAMETAYNSQATDMMNKSNAMQLQNEQATQMSQAENAITSAQLAANGGSITIDVIPNDQGPAHSDGSTAYITQSEAQSMSNNGISTIPTGIGATVSVSADDISSLTSSINDIEQTESGNSEYTLLELQMDTQNLQQDSSLATSGLKTIGDAQESAARNV
jgi:hypothetical protein